MLLRNHAVVRAQPVDRRRPNGALEEREMERWQWSQKKALDVDDFEALRVKEAA